MRSIDYKQIVTAVEKLCIQSCLQLPEDVRGAIEKAANNETEPKAARILSQLLENAAIAEEKHIPLCQDTGLTIVFIDQGAQVTVTPPADNAGATINDAVNEGVKLGYEKGLLRKSVVAEPLNQRKNTQTNTPAVIHHSVTGGDRISITVMAKGGGCENKSRFVMFNPTEDRQTVIDWIVEVVKQAGANACPPFVVGVGLGGNFEQCCLISKKALLRNLDDPNDDPFYAEMEQELLAKINALNIGPQGLGGKTTALAVKIQTAPCHIASLPVAVNIECHSHRHKSIIL